MGYNQDNYRRIREEYETKYLKAQEAADMRRAEVRAAIPEVANIDRQMSRLGLDIMEATYAGEHTAEQIAKVRAKHEQLRQRRRLLMVSYGFAPDYTDIRYECPLCSDTGFVDCKMCVCMKRKLTEAAFETSGIANLLRTQTFDNFKLEYYQSNLKAYQTAQYTYEYMKNYAERFEAGVSGNVMLLGGTGLGKTHLSSAVAGVVIGNGFDVYYTTSVGMLSDFEHRRFGNASGGVNNADTVRYYETDLLIIDDLGTEICNQFTASVMYDVINTRINRKKATLISTNLTSEEIRSRYADRITSRIFGEYALFLLSGVDVRKQKLQKQGN